jgi:hypothetical protein
VFTKEDDDLIAKFSSSILHSHRVTIGNKGELKLLRRFAIIHASNHMVSWQSIKRDEIISSWIDCYFLILFAIIQGELLIFPLLNC